MKRILYSATFSLALALLSVPALAQNDPPVLNQLPTAPPPSAAPAAAPAPVLAAPPAPATGDPLVLGQTYIVVTQQGNSFTGRLVNMGLSVLEFDTQELGHVSLERSKISQMSQLNGAKVGLRNNSYYDIGNGNRLFFAPTGRGLRKGEGSVQDVDVYLLGVNYGISNYFSIGGYLSILPGVSITNQLLVLTPKFSFPINGNDKLNFGTGLLYVRVPTGNDNGIGAGIVYGALTYGSADNNLTVGLGYGFVEGDIGSTPIIQLGGQTRVSRRISLITENYIVADSKAGVGGLYGLKINWRRTSLGLGAAYFYAFGYDEAAVCYDPYTGQSYPCTQHQGGYGFSTYVLPVYADFTFRFGKGMMQNR